MLRMPVNGVEFSLSHEKCEIAAWLSHDDPNGLPAWSIRVQCAAARLLPLAGESDEALRERREWLKFVADEGCHAELDGLALPVKSWRDLAGQRLSADYEHADAHPIMPDTPGTFYFDAHHLVANRNRIAFGNPRGNRFPVHWKFEAEESEEEGGPEVEIKAEISFRRIIVSFSDPRERSFARAMGIAERFADRTELGEPTELKSNWVVVPVRES